MTLDEPRPETPVIPIIPMMELEPSPRPAERGPEPEHECAIMAPPAGKLPVVAQLLAAPNESRGRMAAGMWNWVLPSFLTGLIFVFLLFGVQLVIGKWRAMDAQAEADALYLKRRAELKAEAEHADERLDLLDKKLHLTSLGFREVVRKVAPLVVNVANYKDPHPEPPPMDPRLRDMVRRDKGRPRDKDVDDMDQRDMAPLPHKKILFFDRDNGRQYVQAGMGSGVIFKPGVIMTNYHVVKGADRLRISLASGQSIGVDPNVIAADAITDLALIRLPDDMPAALQEDLQKGVVFADSDKEVQVGDWALAIGSPLGLRQTVTQGIISAKGRLVNMLEMVELLQTDAAINPGNSGGPLFDQLGRLTGINVAIVTDNGGNQGIGFAIPSNTAKKIGEQLMAKGEVLRGYLGVGMEELPGAEAKKLQIDAGIVIKQVLPNEAASKAGVKPGDIIVGMNKKTLNPMQPTRHFRQLVVDVEPGTEITLEVLRGRERLHLPVVVGKRPFGLP
jgi:S1-C subfamily serine protease